MSKLKKNLFFLFFIVAGIIIGALLGNVCEGVSFLKWLSYGGTIGFAADQPAVIELIIFRLQFGFSFTVNVAQIFTIGFALWLYSRFKWN